MCGEKILNKTKIVCTLGPSSLSRHVIKKMYNAGMSGVRINTAYGTTSQYKGMIESVREIGEMPIIVDIKGPEIRIRAKKRMVHEGEVFDVGFNGQEISFNWDFYDKMVKGDLVIIDNGRVRTRVVEKINRTLRLKVMSGGEIADGKGVNVPNKQLAVPTLSKKDKEIIQFAKKSDVEYIALSFTRSAQDVSNLKSEAEGFNGAIVAKIENSEGINKFTEILECADGIMVARGDMGVEIEPEKVPLVQKSIIKACNQKGKPVITATEMLESMMQQPIPTRAEVSDVANAILDGTDATMLSGETAVGKYPVESVAMMSRIATEAEKATHSRVEEEGFINISDAISKAVQRICRTMPISKVVTLTRSGYTARMIARFKIPQPIIAVTPDERVKRQLELVFGVYPATIDYQKQKDHILHVANNLYSMDLIKDEDTVLFTAAFRTLTKHASNLIEIHNVKELRSYTRNRKQRLAKASATCGRSNQL
jgi:pyruvate kinase